MRLTLTREGCSRLPTNVVLFVELFNQEPVLHGTLPTPPRDRIPPLGLLLAFAGTAIWMAFLGWGIFYLLRS